MAKIFNVPFASSGGREDIPQSPQIDGAVSYSEGYTPSYAVDPETDPSARDIERMKFNALMHSITEAVFELQRHGVALWSIDAAPYPAKARVYYDGAIWSSTVGNNSAVPGSNGNWALNEILFSSQGQAEGGINDTTAMTPLRVRQSYAVFGLGAPAPVITDWNLASDFPTQWLRGNSAANGPSGVTGWLQGHYDQHSANNGILHLTQLVGGGSARSFQRVRSGGTWAPWQEIYLSSNQLSIGTTPAAARTALALGAAAQWAGASQVQAEAGAADGVAMTPLRSTQHLNANVVSAVAGKNIAPATVQGASNTRTTIVPISVSFTPTAAHTGQTMTGPSGTVVTIPEGLPAGTTMLFINTSGTGQMVFNAGTGLTLQASRFGNVPTAYSDGPLAVAGVVYRSANTAVIFGNVTDTAL